MSSNRYQHLKPRVKASGLPYHSSIASRSKRYNEMQRQAELDRKKLLEWNQLNEKNPS